MKINPDFPYDVYRMLAKPLRDEDNGVLERFLGGIQTEFERTHANILALRELFDCDRCPDWAVPYLLRLVGWTSELDYVIEDLTSAQQRKILRFSAQLWRWKGTEQGIKLAIRAFTGSDVIIWNWFYLRAVADVSVIGQAGATGIDFWVCGSEFGQRDEYLSIVWAKAAADERQVIHDIIGINRPLGESYFVNYVELLDDFHMGISKWEKVAGTAAWDDSNFNMTLAAGSTYLQPQSLLDLSLTWVWLGTFQFAATSEVRVIFQSDGTGDQCYQVRIGGGTVSLVRRTSAIDVILSSGPYPAPGDLVAGVKYQLAVFTMEDAYYRTWTVKFDGEDIFAYQETPSDVLAVGQLELSAMSDDIIVDNVIGWIPPLFQDRVTAADEPLGAPGAISPSSIVLVAWPLLSSWTVNGLWHLTSFRHITVKSLYCGRAEAGYWPWGIAGDYRWASYDQSSISPMFDCSEIDVSSHTVYAEFYQQTRIDYVNDTSKLIILVAGHAVKMFTNSETVGLTPLTDWTQRRIDITPWVAGQSTAQLKFLFNSNVAPATTDEGWYIDNVRIIVEAK